MNGFDLAFYLVYATIARSKIHGNESENEIKRQMKKFNDKWKGLEFCETEEEVQAYIERRKKRGVDCGWC